MGTLAVVPPGMPFVGGICGSPQPGSWREFCVHGYCGKSGSCVAWVLSLPLLLLPIPSRAMTRASESLVALR